ncbi:MAG: hypothetical protein A3H69_00430 [Candidatus Sungbacteria bacterium RIFCSPLOWO2_02_FULL_47_9]|uniref:histidine kinase n=2 Tax=Parcubacteria group TaxID=1794811 RepID=A0A1G2RPX9_9BACT|nr:MAG: Multi-sensor signal transduction histidine kinase [Parcubacteria group bacterium GW2011_GWA2_47_10]OGZ93965.1 MAG: hypothetical protein A2633_00800 [Candidatus Sungbacteria bacterium RIFCSPHIGHO2_01_FULL_47_32]OHA11096.1 MAG: hypothetical protein A3H69_00430 [Candidatus Sungbacteria bacterium RIFCSPLOWO2_02_FULL_47_9]OHA74920.1 MAG: hypothetical protein A3A32_03675 [Candidatus Wildermuthbacteria bacterium RIFCSPLOWO2_01_FULL_48_35]
MVLNRHLFDSKRMKLETIQDIMTKDVVSVFPETPLIEAAKVLYEHRYDGVPVVDSNNALLGILTEYDLVSKGSAVHLPTLQKIFSQLAITNGMVDGLKEEAAKISTLTVRDVMNAEPLTLQASATIQEAVTLFLEHHRVNPIPVVDENQRVIGVIKTSYDENLGPVWADERMYRIVLQNFVSNAVKYTPDGGTVTVELKKEGANIIMRVSDTGYGIQKSEQARVFSKLFRGENIRERIPEGTGLGLYLVKMMVDKVIGGAISFASEEGKGTTFVVTVPMSRLTMPKKD